jgi:antitoxin VapB
MLPKDGRRVDATKMSLNIKSKETHRLARELADLTGESLTEAVTIALEQRLQRIRRERGAGLAERILALGRDASKHIKDEYRHIDHAELLYDERGLPR